MDNFINLNQSIQFSFTDSVYTGFYRYDITLFLDYVIRNKLKRSSDDSFHFGIEYQVKPNR